MLDTAQLLHRARRGCWAYPGYAIYGADAHDNKTLNETRTEFGAHVIMSSPLILSIDITDPATGSATGKPAGCPTCPNQLDLYWDIIANKEAIAVNQQWAGSVGALIRKWNPASVSPGLSNMFEASQASRRQSVATLPTDSAQLRPAERSQHDCDSLSLSLSLSVSLSVSLVQENESLPLYAWGVACNSSDVSKSVWKADATGELSLEYGGEPLCLEKDSNGLLVTQCNSSSPTQGFALNTTSGTIEHLDLGHGNMKPSESCVKMTSVRVGSYAPTL